ncbi:cbb3-type cytochrome c oxidase subunit III [Roseimicrobium gellanilyticum]|uniref:Cbb3-type cytochrome c oxidase subunit III n=1 Tax=Roseimicrobium gellanilyticum TaxID=748857 RepID=A0A366HUY8_9BACT|nr:cytochrome c [Roseimicrobium gellanilyticum]RBP47499.1 cbb3-type cytochrome c oxidase subunit III [Roseimicrobium gellanilyticum]
MNENAPQNFDSTDLDRLHAAVKREKPDVRPGAEPSPLWVFIATMVAMVFGGGYLGAYVGGFGFDRNSPFDGTPKDVRPIIQTEGGELDPFQFAMKKGAGVYNICGGCHGAAGTGQPGAIPPLAGSEWVLGGTERTTRVILHGLGGAVQVKGVTYNGVMPPQGALSDKEISYVLTYIRNSWGNSGHMVTPEMVKKVREETATHAAAYTQAELDAFKDKDIEGPIPAGPGATVAPAAAPAPAK